MRSKLYSWVVLMFLPLISPAIEAAFSHGVYYLPDPIFTGKINPYVEVYWQVNPKTVHYKTIEGKGIVAQLQTDVTITNDSGKIIKEDHYLFQTVPKSNAKDLGTLNILELKRYFIFPGKVNIQLQLTDINDTSNRFSGKQSFTAFPQPQKPFYSDAEFIDTVFDTDIRTPFLKHGKQYVPLSEGFFDNYRTSLNYFIELYQVDQIDTADLPLYQSVFISKKANEEPYSAYLRIDTLKTLESKFFSGSYNIADLSSGNYYLSFSLGNRHHKTIATQNVFFQRFNTRDTKEQTIVKKAVFDSTMEKVNILDLSKTFVAKYTLPQVTAILKMIRPVVDPSGARAIDGFLTRADEMYMRYFVYNFFKSQNAKSPEKAWKEYSDKVKQVNKLYTKYGKQGYETARGFMYLRYGPPSEVVTENFEKDALPYEIWQYNQLKEMSGKEIDNAIILFFKRSESDFDYTVLHTTITDDIHNLAWRNYLYGSGASGDHSNSRADQYIGTR